MRLYLGGYLDFYNPQQGNWLEVQLEGPSPLKDVLLGLGIPLGDIQLVVHEGELVDLDETVVIDQDEVKLFPAVGGG